MPARALLNGEPAADAIIFDRACQFGDGLFETIAVRDGKPCLWSRHISRLLRGCERLGLDMPDPVLLLEETARLCAEREQAVLKILVSAGRSAGGYARDPESKSTRLLICNDWHGACPWFDCPPLLVQECTTRLATQPMLAGIKHLNRLEQVLARRELRDDCQEGVLFDQDGRPVEGVMSNLVLKFEDHYLTPSLNNAGVAGTVRELLIDNAASLELPLKIAQLERNALFRAEALFMTNALRGIQPVAQLEDHRYRVSRRSAVLDTLHAACFTFSGDPAWGA